METCLKCGKLTKDDIIALPSCGQGYNKKECTQRGISYPLKYWRCEHCQAFYVADRYGEYKLYVGELPFNLKELINA